jgi:hypothetical protein
MTRAPVLLGALVLAAGALAGCGLGAGDTQAGPDARVSVTRDFGHHRLGASGSHRVRDDETVLRLLRADHSVKTRYGGGFVQSIDGLAGNGPAGGSDWFYYLDGVLSDTGASEQSVHPGDVLQWDYRYYRAAPNVRAIVGAFPRPLAGGSAVRLACERAAAAACRAARRALARAGVRTAVGSLATADSGSAPRVVVARWSAAQRLSAARVIERGSRVSGVFARYDRGGRSLQLLDAHGQPAGQQGPGAGLVAAFAPPGEQPLWLVTGGDEAGVRRAAGALDRRALADAFAVAVTPGGRVIRLPAGGSGR